MPRSDRTADWRETLIVHAALETGLLQEFAEPSTPEASAARAELDARAARAVATALRAAGVLSVDMGERRRHRHALRIEPVPDLQLAHDRDDAGVARMTVPPC